uniref:Uncharacterized protein n=1 Tax=Cucumis melo TaxID=3656 RepID=A0A9I9EIM7_CUCME
PILLQLGQGHSVIVVPSVLLQPNVHSFQTSSAERVGQALHVVLAPELAKLLPKNRLFLSKGPGVAVMKLYVWR